MSDANFDYWELKFWEAYGYYPNFLRKEGDDRAEFRAFVEREKKKEALGV